MPQQQAAAVGIELNVYDAQADNCQASKRTWKTAIGFWRWLELSSITARQDTMCPLIVKATDAGIPVVVYDIEITECAP